MLWVLFIVFFLQPDCSRRKMAYTEQTFWSFRVLKSSESLSVERKFAEPALDLPENLTL